MYKDQKILLIAPAYNEENKIGFVVKRTPRQVVDQILVIDDGSTDATAEVARSNGAFVINLGSVKGVGFAIRTGFEYALQHNFNIVVVIAGNNKDSPEEIPYLLDPICDRNADFVIGSRYVKQGVYGGDMPFYRKLATRFHPLIISLLFSKRIKETTNGFRAMKVSLLKDTRINLYQKWLDHYELEVYLLIKLIMLKYQIEEVPCTKIYPPHKLGNTKMRFFTDWLKMLKPIFYLRFGIKS